MKPPLRGVLVVELAKSLAGPLAGMMLCDLGARVIKVEPPGGDETRGWGPPFVGKLSTYFISANRGKESLVLDLKQAGPRAILRKLLSRADIVIDNFRPSTARRLGLKIPRRCIHCVISGYGLRGPLSEKPAYDLIIQAESGAMLLNGEPDGPPMKIGITLADVLAAHYAVQRILAARLSGQSGLIDVSLLDSILAGLTHQSQSFLSTGRVPARHGNDHPSLYPYGIFKVRDGYIAIGVANERQWEGLARVLDRPDWVQAYPSNRRRVENRSRLQSMIRQALSRWRKRELLSALGRRQVPAGAVQTLDKAYQMIPRPKQKRAPRLGEHTQAILKELSENE
jgi:crotonobetainyl-CoA:carnitine CoA-transferase CaiB-like acyl-CoA transferase